MALNGTASTDPEGAALTYAWVLQVPGGSSASLSSATSSQPSFVADVAGSYTATLTVSDGALDVVGQRCDHGAGADAAAASVPRRCGALHGEVPELSRCDQADLQPQRA